MFRLLLLPVFLLSACSGVPSVSLPLPGGEERGRGAFIPRDEYPTPPNVANMIGPEDCRGSTLSALSAEIPDYPDRAYQRGRQGWAVVRFHVYSDGSVHRARIARAIPEGVFDRAARRAVERWEFRPLDGVDVLENCVVMFEFRQGEVRIR